MVPPAKNEPVNIVGAGVFGLSTALHLAKRGYTNVTVFDKQPYDTTLYSYFKGCDAASADINKIVRSAYGSQTEYQELTFEAIKEWTKWNEELASGKDLPPGMSTSDRVFHNCGNLSLTDGDVLHPFELATIKTMEACGHKDTQLVTNDARHAAIAKERGQAGCLDPFQRKKRGKPNIGVLDSTGGVAIADKACRLALHKARRQGARFILDPDAGAFSSFMKSPSGKVTGITTKDGKAHPAMLTVMACGGWTGSLLPQLDHLCEATAGSVIIYKIPQTSQLWDRTSPESFPTWMWKMRDGAKGGLYGFPRTEDGYFKIGYRGTKYTNPQKQADGVERSVPVTRWSEGDKLKQIPAQAMKVLKDFAEEYLPELGDEGIDIALTRVCWYNDSYDNHLIIDYAPEQDGLFVATAGSGHAFKYLPIMGKWVVDIIEGVGMDRPAVKAWKWRTMGDEKPFNVLMEGGESIRALQNTRLTSDADLKLRRRARL